MAAIAQPPPPGMVAGRRGPDAAPADGGIAAAGWLDARRCAGGVLRRPLCTRFAGPRRNRRAAKDRRPYLDASRDARGGAAGTPGLAAAEVPGPFRRNAGSGTGGAGRTRTARPAR